MMMMVMAKWDEQQHKDRIMCVRVYALDIMSGDDVVCSGGGSSSLAIVNNNFVGRLPISLCYGVSERENRKT